MKMTGRFEDELARREQDVYLLKEEKRLKSSIERVRERLPQYSSSLLRCLLEGVGHEQALELAIAIGRTMSLIVQVQGVPYVIVHDYLFYDKSLKKNTKKLYKQMTRKHKSQITLKALTSRAFQDAYAQFVKAIYMRYYEKRIVPFDDLKDLVQTLRGTLL